MTKKTRGEMVSNKAKQLMFKICTFSIICSTLNIFLFEERNVFMNITIIILDIAIGGVAQYELVSMLKQYEGTNPKKYKVQTILGSIVLWWLVWFFSSRYFYMIF